jgi:hypothetical protein
LAWTGQLLLGIDAENAHPEDRPRGYRCESADGALVEVVWPEEEPGSTRRQR